MRSDVPWLARLIGSVILGFLCVVGLGAAVLFLAPDAEEAVIAGWLLVPIVIVGAVAVALRRRR